MAHTLTDKKIGDLIDGTIEYYIAVELLQQNRRVKVLAAIADGTASPITFSWKGGQPPKPAPDFTPEQWQEARDDARAIMREMERDPSFRPFGYTPEELADQRLEELEAENEKLAAEVKRLKKKRQGKRNGT